MQRGVSCLRATSPENGESKPPCVYVSSFGADLEFQENDVAPRTLSGQSESSRQVPCQMQGSWDYTIYCM